MRGLACVLVALAACGDGGVVIIVDPAPGMNVDEVRLYLGHGDRSMTSRLTTVQGGVDNPAYWTRDVNNEADLARPDALDGPVGFTLVRGDADTIPVAIAIGFSQGKVVGESVRTDIPIPNNHDFIAYHLPLHGPVSTLDSPSMREVGLWSPPGGAQDADQQACVGVALDIGGNQTHAFVVTANDQDCDGIASDDPLECDPDTYRADRPANRGEISCIAPMMPNCYLGGPHCKDGAPKGMKCEATSYCMPTTVCNGCPSTNDLTCPTDPVRITNTAMTAYHCTVAIDTSNGEACDSELVLERPPTGGFDCSAAAIRGAMGPFANHLDLGSSSVDVKLDPGCAVTLQPNGKLPTGSFAALLAFDLDTKVAGDDHGLGMPITFEIMSTSGCAGSPSSCSLDSTAFVPDLTRCMAGWSSPTRVPNLSDGGLPTDPSLTDDMLEMYFEDAGHIFVATRPDVVSPWTTTGGVVELDMPGTERGANVSPDGLTMIFASDVSGTYRLYTSSRSNRTAPWALPILLQASLVADMFEGAPDESGDHLVVVVGGVGTFDLQELVRSGTGPYTPGPPMTFSSGALEMAPYLSPNGLHLYFASNLNTTGNAHIELFVASRNTVDESFGTAVQLVELGSNTFDGAPWVSRDGHTMFFASDRGATANAIFTATR